MSDRPVRLHRSAFRHFRPIATRWMDNDAYGHVNNVMYYSFFDTAVTGWLIEKGLLEIGRSSVVGLVVETGCTYFESVAFPDALEVGMAIAHLGRSSVRYRLGIFRAGAAQTVAQGHFVHVYVDRETQRPAGIPADIREAFNELAEDGR